MINPIVMIILCAFATMLPRMIPYFLPFISRLPRFIRKCMMMLPVASLGALIFPLARTDFGPEWLAGLVGVASSFIVSFFKGSMILSIVVALAATTLVLVLI